MSGNYFERVAKERTTAALVELINLGAKEARTVFGERIKRVPIDEVSSQKVLIQRTADTFAAYFVPGVIPIVFVL